MEDVTIYGNAFFRIQNVIQKIKINPKLYFIL